MPLFGNQQQNQGTGRCCSRKAAARKSVMQVGPS
jgi:hypothetical protein